MNIGTKPGGGITRVGERASLWLVPMSHMIATLAMTSPLRTTPCSVGHVGVGGGTFIGGNAAIAGEFADDPLVQNIVAFVRAGGKRPLMRPNVKRGVEEKEGDAF